MRAEVIQNVVQESETRIVKACSEDVEGSPLSVNIVWRSAGGCWSCQEV